MRLIRFTNYLLEYRAQSLMLMVLLAFASAFDPTGIFGSMLATAGIVIAAFITLVRGTREGIYFTIAATLPYAVVLLMLFKTHTAIPLFFWLVIGVAVLSNVLTTVFAVMLKRQMRFGAIAQVAVLLGVLAISVIHIVYPDVTSWWATQLQTRTAQLAGMVSKQGATASTSELQLEVINVKKYYATGFIVAAILLEAFMQLILARWWQASVYTPGSLKRELHNVRLTPLAGVLFVVSLLLTYLGNVTILDIMPVIYLLFCAAGLSLIHYYLGLMISPTKWFWLSLLYITLFIAMPISIMLVALIGLTDIWVDTRKRFNRA